MFEQMVLKSHPMGSRYVCDPPVMDTDKDTLILVAEMVPAVTALLNEGWTMCNNGEYIEGFFMALRKGEDNYVLTANELFFERYLVAAQVAKALNVQCKNTRIAIHKACVEAGQGFVGLVNW